MRRLLIVVAVGAAAMVAVGTGVAAPAPPAPAAVKLVEVKFDKDHGTATILVDVSGPGTLTLKGGRLVGRSVPTSGAGIAKLKVASKGGALKTLIKTGAVEVRVTVEFVAAEGARATAVRTITLHRPHHGRRSPIGAARSRLSA